MLHSYQSAGTKNHRDSDGLRTKEIIMSSAREVTAQTFPSVLTSTKPVLVDFYATWCGPCKMVSPIVDAIAGKYADTVEVCKINTDEQPQLAAQYQITAIPTCIVFKNGTAVDRIMGYKPQEAFEAMIAKHL
jgi:thioredoxin 1